MPSFKIPQKIQDLATLEPDEKEQALVFVDLEELGEQYIDLDKREKVIKKKKDEVKAQLMDLMTKAVHLNVEPERKEVTIAPGGLDRFGGDFKKWVAYYYPTYTLAGIESTAPDGSILVSLVENLELRKYAYNVGEFQVGRTLQMKGAELDVEELLNDEALAHIDDHAVEALDAAFQEKQVIEWSIDEEGLIAAIADYPELMPIVQKYSFAGKPAVQMLPVSKAKEEDV